MLLLLILSASLVLNTVLAGLWFGTALLFGFHVPTPDQFGGLVLIDTSLIAVAIGVSVLVWS